MGSAHHASRGAIGGASDDAGVEYRRGVAAYAVAHGLAGVALVGFGVPRMAAIVSAVSLETDNPVDDVAIEFESGWQVTVQARRTLRKGKPIDSAIAQWRIAAAAGLDPGHERLILVTSSMPGWIRNLKAVLERFKTDRPGPSTVAEASALGYLESQLAGLTPAQYEAVLKSAMIHLLFVEEPEVQHSREACRLLDEVVGRSSSPRAWRDLVTLGGRTARVRGGFTLPGWLDLLKQEGHQILNDGNTAAAHLVRQQAAYDRYSSQLRQRGQYVDLRPLGATLPPLPLSSLDARIPVIVPGRPDRDQGDLLWAFLRRGRMLLTGLPGGGKSTAISITAARLLDVPDGPVPIVVSLRDIDSSDRSAGFGDRLLNVAVRALSSADRALVRGMLERLLHNGGAAIFLDSLDETHDRRGQVISELHDYLNTVSENVDVLLATRDVAYAQAATLGWPSLQLSPPKEIDRSIEAILEASATAAGEVQREDWVRTRVGWVQAVLARDVTLRETPLLPILLALLAAEKSNGALPQHRAAILWAVVKNVVERREARRALEFRVGELTGESAASAILDGFAVEAAEIGASGGQCPLARARRAIAEMLACRWDLHQGPAVVAADAIVRFWDENGILIVLGAMEMVTPRVELYAEIGEAISVVQRPEEDIVTWVDAAAGAGRFESIILAAGLSEVAARQLLAIASTTDDRQLLLAAATAVREGATVGESESFTGLVNALARDASLGDAEAWQTWLLLVELPLPEDLRLTVTEALASFPAECHAIGRALMILKGLRESAASENTNLLLDALRVTNYPDVPQREKNDKPYWSIIAFVRSFGEAKDGAAEMLLGVVEAATPFVVDELRHTTMDMDRRQRLGELLERRGFGHLAQEVFRAESSQLREAMRGILNFDRDAHKAMLLDLCKTPSRSLTYQEATRLDELADFCQSMRFNGVSAWPRGQDSRKDFRSLLATVQQLGGFDPAVLSAQARIALNRIDAFSNNDPFFALFDQAARRRLDNWHRVLDQDATVRLLVRMLFLGRDTALVAADALWGAPIARKAVPLLVDALPRLESSPSHQRIAAYTLLSLTNGTEVEQWARSPNPVLRRVSAEKSHIELDGTLTTEIHTLLRDGDGYVVQSAVERLSGELSPTIEAELTRIANAPNPAWMCLHCRTHNEQGNTACRQCMIVGPNPPRAAAARLGKRQQT
jgi:hypothetical protein